MGNTYSPTDDEYVANKAWVATCGPVEDTVTIKAEAVEDDEDVNHLEDDNGNKQRPIKQVWVVAAKLDPTQMAEFNDDRKIFNSPSATGVIRSHISFDVFLPLFCIVFDGYVRELKKMTRYGIRVILLISSTANNEAELGAVAGIMIKMHETFEKAQRPIYVANTFHWAQTGTTEITDPAKFATFNFLFNFHFCSLVYGPQSIPQKQNRPPSSAISSRNSIDSILIGLHLSVEEYNSLHPNNTWI